MLALFENVNIPPRRILFLHVKLRDLHTLMRKDYTYLSHELIATLQSLYQPTAILVPTYTIYSFMFGGIFHSLFSKSEVGRFSEEVRCRFSQFRTPDPMFSIADVTGYLKKLPNTIYSKMFEQDGLLHYLTEQNYIIVNIGLDVLYTTQVHLVEKRVGVDYRFDKKYEGIVYHDAQTWEKVVYPAYVRKVDQNKVSYPTYNQRKREEYLINNSELQIVLNHSIKISWISSQTFTRAIQTALLQDRHFLI